MNELQAVDRPPHFQINGGALTLKSDVFSLGSIFWEVSNSRIPFEGVDDLDRIRADINKKPPKLLPFGCVHPWHVLILAWMRPTSSHCANDFLTRRQEVFKEAVDVREACQRLVTLCHEVEAILSDLQSYSD